METSDSAKHLGVDSRWVYSPLVEEPGNHKIYDYTKSPNSQLVTQTPAPGAEPVNATFDISYSFDDSRVRGLVVNEDISIGATPPVSMNIEVATEVDSFLFQLAQAPTLPVFTIDGNPQRPHSKPTVEIGKIDREKANGDLSYALVNNTDGWWAVDNITFEVEGEKIANRHGMIFGSSIISVQSATAKAYYEHVPGAQDRGNNGTYFFPCESKMPDFKLYMGNGTGIYRSSLLKQGSQEQGSKSNGLRPRSGDDARLDIIH
ncbi:MAG: hypothetical protein LQ345_000926 [Seirophora villosa]|nr:MAG: hypothetical protein LQ345_000926 [Seirophora villosa]